MLSLYFVYSEWLFSTYLQLYIVLSQIHSLLSFYPIGILLSLFILYYILYMVICCGKIINWYTSQILYLLNGIEFISFVNQLFPNKLIRLLVVIIYDTVVFYSIYLFIFYTKRVEFYIFWIFVFCTFTD